MSKLNGFVSSPSFLSSFGVRPKLKVDAAGFPKVVSTDFDVEVLPTEPKSGFESGSAPEPNGLVSLKETPDFLRLRSPPASVAAAAGAALVVAPKSPAPDNACENSDLVLDFPISEEVGAAANGLRGVAAEDGVEANGFLVS